MRLRLRGRPHDWEEFKCPTARRPTYRRSPRKGGRSVVPDRGALNRAIAMSTRVRCRERVQPGSSEAFSTIPSIGAVLRAADGQGACNLSPQSMHLELARHLTMDYGTPLGLTSCCWRPRLPAANELATWRGRRPQQKSDSLGGVRRVESAGKTSWKLLQGGDASGSSRPSKWRHRPGPLHLVSVKR